MMIGTPIPDFVDTQEEFMPKARESSYEEFFEDDDNTYGDGDSIGLKEEIWPPELL
jgi:hypothetical protein